MIGDSNCPGVRASSNGLHCLSSCANYCNSPTIIIGHFVRRKKGADGAVTLHSRVLISAAVDPSAMLKRRRINIPDYLNVSSPQMFFNGHWSKSALEMLPNGCQACFLLDSLEFHLLLVVRPFESALCQNASGLPDPWLD